MKNNINILFIFLSVFSCIRENDLSTEVSVSIILNDKEIKSSEYDNKFKIKYTTNFSSDTAENISKNGYLNLPKNDSGITYLEVSFDKYNTSLSGEYLENMLPVLLGDSLTFWKLRIDTPPFEDEYMNDSNEVKAIGLLITDFGDLTWRQL